MESDIVQAVNNLKNWQLFATVGDSGSLSAAADAMDLELSHASRLIAKLEDELGFPILDRTVKPARLAKAAAPLLPAARALVQIHASLLATAGTLAPRRAHSLQTIRVGVPLNTDCPALYKAFLAFEERHPGLRIQPATEYGVAELFSRRTDVVKCSERPRSGELFVRPLDSTVTMLLASREYVAEHGLPESPEDLKRHMMLLRNTDHPAFSTRLEKGDEVFYLDRSGPIRQGDVNYCINLMLAGVGIAVDVSLSRVQAELASGAVVPVLPGWHREPWVNSLVCRKIDAENPEIIDVMDVMAAHFNGLGTPLWHHWFRHFGIPLKAVKMPAA